ncbi:hypothetical protein [Streptomyces flavidovirens]
MSTSAPTIPAETANHVLFHYGRGGYQAGSFTTYILSAFATADEVNFHRLATAFPDYGAAVAAIQYDRDGVAHLQRIADGKPAAGCGCGVGPWGPDGCESCAGGKQ